MAFRSIMMELLLENTWLTLLVEGIVLVELKAVKALDDIHAAQCLNYLKATGIHICLLINFGRPRVEVKRIILTTDGHR
jgi:GxxExxY protein